ncbi:hypothetical protein baBA2_000868 (plasmid) [Borrelia anserina]|nr:hypothetical protein [Borrelia anserina]UPA07246.1 hypothetical protein baBA2_000868 [Borrelia anserina]
MDLVIDSCKMLAYFSLVTDVKWKSKSYRCVISVEISEVKIKGQDITLW